MTESLYSTMDVCGPEPLDTKNGVIQFFRLLVNMFVLFLISYKFDVCLIGKKLTVLFMCMNKRVKLIVFAVSMKFCDELSQAI